MKKLFIIAAAIITALTGAAKADSSYLLIQGPFGVSGAEMTFKWRLDYAPGDVITGADLLNAILGTPTFNAGLSSATREYWTSGNTEQGAGYRNTDYGLMLDTFTLRGTSVSANVDLLQDWNYYVAGGTGTFGIELVPPEYGPAPDYAVITPGVYQTTYPNAGEWTHSGDGPGTRFLSNGSYDAWVFGTADWFNNTYAQVSGTNTSLATTSFADATIASVPEPSSMAFVGIGVVGLVLRRYRVRKSSIGFL